MPPQNPPSQANLLLGKGQVLFDRFDASGLSTGMVHLGNVERFELTTADDVVKKYSSMSASAPLYGQSLRRRDITLRLTADEFHPDNLALASMGSVSTLVQAATAVVAEAVFATTIKGAYFKLQKMGPYTGIAVKFGAGTGVLGVDYRIVNATMGIIQILFGTALTGAVTVDYTPTAYVSTTGPKIVGGGNASTILGKCMFIGDPSVGPAALVEVWRANLEPDGAIGLISDDYATLEMTLSILDDSINHPANPLYQVTYSP